MPAYRPPTTHRTSRTIALEKGTDPAGFVGPNPAPAAKPPPPAPHNPYGPPPAQQAPYTNLRPLRPAQ